MDYKRQVSIFDPENFKDVEITIAGLGNIGSHTALALARMGLRKFHLFDDDVIEAHNLSSQAYGLDQIGEFKVISCSDSMFVLNRDVEVNECADKFTGAEQQGKILISAVDSMEARREICKNLPADTYVIDGRMGGGQIEVWSQPASEWAATLERDGDTDPCGARYISYTSYIIAGLIANQVKRHLMHQKVQPRILLHVDTLELLKV